MNMTQLSRLLLFLTILSLFTLCTSAAPTSFAEIEESWQKGLSEVNVFSFFPFLLSNYPLLCPITTNCNINRETYTKKQPNPPPHPITLISHQHPNPNTTMKKQSSKACWMHAPWLYAESFITSLAEDGMV
jgi:hypothetical protein